MKKLAVGILAHVDAGKTTLSEAMLYMGGSIRKMGRVDRGDAFLDTYELEKKRGITIFSKQAILKWKDMEMTLLDTPGHVDFSAEMERTLQVLDYAILVISGTDGVQEHTRTLWRLLARYRVPTFLFINKMDLAGLGKGAILDDLRKILKETFVDFGEAGTDHFYEQIAMTSEELLDEYLETGHVETAGIREQIISRRLFPCFFGSALKFTGVEEFMKGLEEYTETPEYPPEFGAKIFKISRDAQGNRMSHMKITGGSLSTREIIDEEKVNQIRLYSGEKFETVREASAGTVCAVLGLSKAVPGQGLGIEAASAMPLLEPVMTYRIGLPEGVDAAAVLPKFRELEEEDPELHLTWEESKKEIHVQIMGEIQMEILKSVIEERFGLSVEFGDRSIVYRETITNTVEGVGHFEPLRHYAEVHLLLEPGEPGSGMQFASACSEDILGRNWQRLVLTHLEEKDHRGVLTGSVITDMKITLLTGRSHLKHTEGGDFRQATYRAVRQGLMQARSILLEPWYQFRLEVPEKMVGRAMTDIEKMYGIFDTPRTEGEMAVLTGSAPVFTMRDYQKDVIAYTKGYGRLFCTLLGYRPCHNAEEVIENTGYDPERDTENPTGSVFCAHGAGFVVPWDKVKDYMHLECRILQREAAEEENGFSPKAKAPSEPEWMGVEEIDEILARTYRSNQKNKDISQKGGWNGRVSRHSAPPPKEPVYKGKDSNRIAGKKEKYLLVDGYNVIFAWEDLKSLAEVSIDGARGRLQDILCNYQGIVRCQVIVVFDAYRVQGHTTEILDYHNIHVVYTREAETADQYIEKFTHENGKKYEITVATSDGLEQIIIRGQGCRLLSARELALEVEQVNGRLREEYLEQQKTDKNYLLHALSEKARRQVEKIQEDETS